VALLQAAVEAAAVSLRLALALRAALVKSLSITKD
jgi:hypothetical protein